METKLTEIKRTTKNPKLLLNMYTSCRVLKSWTENFVDEDSGEVVPIERNEVVFDRGILIDQDILAQMKFYFETGDISEVEVSNQRRMAYQLENNSLDIFVAVADMGDKKHKFIFYATGIDMAIPLLKDYIELNYTSGFILKSIKDFDVAIILIDNLKKAIPEDEEPEIDEDTTEVEKKFIQIDFNVEVDGTKVYTSSAVVQTYNVERAMMLINDYLIKQEKIRTEENKQHGRTYESQVYFATIEAAKPIPIGVFIPKEFSMAYMK